MKIKLANLKDMKDIADLEHGSKYKWRGTKKEEVKRVEDLFKKGYCDIYILKEEYPAGYFTISFDKRKKVCYLNYFAVSKKFQGRGFAKLMMKKIISIARKNKCKSIELAVWAKNFSAIGLYNKFEFKFSEIKRNYYPNGDGKIRMIKELNKK